MSRTTRATQALEAAKVAFTLHSYDYDPNAERIGLQAAEALGAPPDTVLKTLMVEADGRPACVVLASDGEVSMKALARALGAKAAGMMKPADAERVTGFVVGGVSPFGQKKRAPTVVDEAALAQFLEMLRIDRGFEDGLPRRTLIDAFNVISDEDLVGQYRRKMASLLF